MLIGGSQLLLYGAIGLAQAMGISEAVIGLTIVAVGTSLPEMAVSVIAALRRHRAAGRKANQGEGNRNGFSAGINRVCCKHPGHRLLKGIHALSLSCAHE